METKDKIIYWTMGLASLAVAVAVLGYSRFKSSAHVDESIDVSGMLITLIAYPKVQICNTSSILWSTVSTLLQPSSCLKVWILWPTMLSWLCILCLSKWTRVTLMNCLRTKNIPPKSSSKSNPSYTCPILNSDAWLKQKGKDITRCKQEYIRYLTKYDKKFAQIVKDV